MLNFVTEVSEMDGNAVKQNNACTEIILAAVVDTVVKKISEKGNSAVVHPIETENEEMIPDVVSNDSVKSDKPVDDDLNAVVDQQVERIDFAACADSVNVTDKLIRSSTKETAVAVTESVLTEAVVSDPEGSTSAEPQNGHGPDSVTKQENKELRHQLECDLKPQCEHLTPHSLLPQNQVSEVNPSLGSQVKSDSVSCNFVSTNQKNELKNTIIANNVKLEQEIVRSKMVEEPSSRIDVPVYEESHSKDVEEADGKKVSVEENSSINRRPNLNKTNSNEDVGYLEKLYLDGSSGDDSMEEDMPESKQFDSKSNVGKLREKGESVEIMNVKEHDTVMVRDGLSSEGGIYSNNDIPSVSPVKKHKFLDQTSVGNNNRAKRRRWNSETVNGSNTQRSTVRPATAPMGEPISLKSNFSWSDSPTIDDALKERIVPPSQWPPTNSLKIDGFLRPFTLKAVQGLLGKTGNFTSFWMDEIKTHCYVSYTTVEEAVETRNAVYNLQWPPNVGRLLVAEFVEPEDVKMKLEPPPPVDFVNNDSTAPPVPVTLRPPAARERFPPPPALSMLSPAARERFPPPPPLSMLPPAATEQLPPPPPLSELPAPPREWLPLAPPKEWLPLPPPPREWLPLPPPPREWLPLAPPLSNLSPDVRERILSPPPLPKKVDKTIVTIDDVFRKTRATPRIYYLPLSDGQVAAKLAAMGRGVKQ
ncbi:actin cytoskeleton-regulatory complex protein PAN1 [Lathyrus oleraceus]|uniref:Uncharacterized protein n=1 Tax=Pisum sativum TaxID=3888 RepID=A0A9D4VLU7_PEA|nr:actin cytoskeleton-regulatory complex protein PAN1-like [Pisum sativum]KAI5385623.1 hypothetical protein KIW84_072288 [Pisum sativum]